MPLIADENTYLKIANNLLQGKYYLKDYPSTVTPIIPFIIAFLKTTANPIIGLTIHKLLHLFLAILGFRYLYLFLINQNLTIKIAVAIISLAAVNPIGITFFARLYPEGILMFSFWGFIYHASAKINTTHFVKMLVFFVILVLTRYLYAVLGIIILINIYRYYKVESRNSMLRLGLYCLILSLPVLFWAKYVYSIEQIVTSEEVSYFKRFKNENPLIYNIKAGLGLIKHDEVNKVNGIPAFASLFVPVDGYRNYLLSLGLIAAFIIGYFKRKLPFGSKLLILSVLLAMLGLIFAGTGFSRYWLVLLPGFILGYYYLLRTFNFPDKWFIYCAYGVSIVYVLNEFRLDYLILNRYL